MKDFLVRILATGFGAGYSPLAPGTVGTIAAIPVFLLLSAWGSGGVAAGLLVCIAAGIPLAAGMERMMGEKDPKPVVIDEIAGYLVTMVGSPPTLFYMAAGFLVFRFFDVLKPPPIRRLERTLPGGIGIVADDLMAGAYSWAVLRILEALVM